MKKLVGNNNPDSSVSLERICKEGYVNAIKNRTGKIACVKLQTLQKLIQRGWALKEFPEQEVAKTTNEQRSEKSQFYIFIKDASNVNCEKTYTCFIPSVVSVYVGTEVVWINNDVGSHRISSGKVTKYQTGEYYGRSDDVFQSDMLASGETFSYKFLRAGTYEYFSLYNLYATGKIIVLETDPKTESPILTDNQILTVVGDAPCAWMGLHQIPHSELLKRHDRTGANALLLKVNDDNINKVSHLKEMLAALENKTGFQQNEYEKNAWAKRINSTEIEQQKIWNWLKDTFDSQYGKRSDDSFTSYFTYKEKYYQITWALC